MTMYLEHFGLREAPFRITPHTEFFFAGANRGATLEALLYAITAGEGLVKVTGEVGSGKTMLSRVLMERLPQAVETIYLAVPSLSRDEMLAAIAADLGVETAGATTTKVLRALQERLIAIHAEGRQVVALIDEAHAMPLGTLEEVRLLSNLETNKEKLLQVVLFGQPELDVHLNLPNMRQLKERITHAFTLAPLPPRDVKDYVSFRLRQAGYHGPELFGPEALAIITEASEGLTRRINIYADKTLLAAFAAGTHTVTADHARAAVSDTQIVVAPGPSRRPVAFAALAGLAVGVGLGFWLAQEFAGPSVLTVAAAPAPAPKASGPVTAAPPATVPTDPAPASPATTGSAPPEAAASAVTAPATATSAPAPSTPAAAPVTAPTPVPGPAPQARGDTKAAPEPAARVAAAPPTAVLATRPAEPPPVPVSAPVSANDRVESRLAAGRELLSATGNRYGVQLMVTEARERAYLAGFLAEAGRSLKDEDLYLYPAGSGDNARIGVLYGAYESRAEAVNVLNGLPPHLRQFRPYVRSLDAVRDDVRRSGRG